MVRGSDIILILVAIIFPPLAAAMITGCSCDLLINICLTLLGYLPGHLHAFWLIYKKIKAEESFGPGGYTYLGNGNFVGNGPAYTGAPPPPPHGHQQQYYGSTQ
ncbi:hypothetical protein I204_07312 [Kwoniella mangroviensis CBS 8886]|uniref:uncharacterized protein n=1 Tax=Kwoniella botswanensis TaxID=1268659 RepID=UPI00080CFED9|nr:hypothetical protein I204_07312 [Kwoniella mangroviensis CBS 8886]